MSDEPKQEAPDHSAGTDRLPGGRLRLAEVRAEHSADSAVRIVVELADDEERHRGEAEGVGTGAVQLRLAGSATLEAVSRALPETAELRLVGMKRVRAFDADLVLAGLRSGRDGKRPLVGAVPVEGDPDRAAAAAVLDAVNRVLGAPG